MDRAYWEQIAANFGYDTAESLARDHVESVRVWAADLAAAMKRKKRRLIVGYVAVYLGAFAWMVWLLCQLPY